MTSLRADTGTKYDHLFILTDIRASFAPRYCTGDIPVFVDVINALLAQASPELREFAGYLDSLNPCNETQVLHFANGTFSLLVHLGVLEVVPNG